MSTRLAEPGAQPGQVSRVLAGAIASGDLELAAHCFAREGCLLTQDATAIRGREEIRQILAQLIAADCQITVESSSLLPAAEIALLSERWGIRFAAPGGAPFERHYTASLVLRQVGEGWKIAIAAPWGWPAA